MKKIFFSIALLLHVLNSNSQTWGLVWSDEFSGTAIDHANWKFETGAGGWGNNELEYYTAQPEMLSFIMEICSSLHEKKHTTAAPIHRHE
jgi:hypothetical protein